ncbi:MAG TPA: DUF1190 domain-containing protein [Allosphingosinicella sp.]|nr:DUF1190 domain-containing protein [Allosphingosinicella sp.]
MTEIRKTKRSRGVALTTLTATAGTLTLTGCGDDPMVEGQVFPTVAECVAAGTPQGECQEAYNQALADNQNDAPRFESQDLCEGEFGGGQCQQRAEGGGSFWVPLLAGFVIANAIDDVDFDRKKKRKYAPIYMSRANGNYYYGGSNYGPMSRTSSGRYGFAPATLDRPVSAPRVQSRSDIASRGGFGGRASSRGSGG